MFKPKRLLVILLVMAIIWLILFVIFWMIPECREIRLL